MSRLHLIGLVAYSALTAAAVLSLAVERRGRRRNRRARQLLILVVVGATLVAGLGYRDLWPLSSWSLMTGTPTRKMGVDPVYLRLLAVDAAGREFPVDYRAVEPFAIEELMAWMRTRFLMLPSSARDSAATFLLDRLNVARARVRAGKSPGTAGRWLGPLRAPFHLLHPKQWTTIESVPVGPFVALRIYGETWDLEEQAIDPSRVTRRLFYEFRAGAP